MSYVIVKYPSNYRRAGITSVSKDHTYGGYSCEAARVPKYKVYDTLEEVQKDIVKLHVANPGVEYGPMPTNDDNVPERVDRGEDKFIS